MILLQTHMTYEKEFRNFNIQEARLHRRFEKDMAELRRLKAERRDNPATDEEDDLSNMDALFESKFAAMQTALSAQSKGNGFEFSTAPETAPQAPSAASENLLTDTKAA